MVLNKRILVRIALILVILWLCLLGIFYFSTGKYRDHAIGILKAQLDNQLLSEIQINKDDIHLSLCKNFPYISLELSHILVKSAPVADLESFKRIDADTLLYAKRINLSFNIRSLFSKKYELKKIEIEDASLNLLSDRRGNVNYKIIKDTEKDTLQDSIRFDIKKIILRNIEFQYSDLKSNFFYSDLISRGEVTGTFSKDDFLLNIQASTEHADLRIKDSNYLEKEPLELFLNITKGIDNYLVKNSSIKIFGIKVDLSAKFFTSNNNYAIKFSCNSVSLQKTKSALTKFWSDYLLLSPQHGDLNLLGEITSKGIGNPLISLQFEIKNGVLKNSKKNVRISDLYLKGSYTNGKHRNLQTNFLRIDSLSVQSGNSILFLVGQVQNFNTPVFEGRIRGYLELKKLLVIEPLARKFELEGIAKGNIRARGSLSTVRNIRNQDIQNIKLYGVLQFDEAYIKSLLNSLPASTISGTIKVNSLTEISLDDILIQTGKSNLQIKGEASNISFFKNDKSIFPVYRCTVRSDDFHVEDFMVGSSSEKPIRVIFPDSLKILAGIYLKSFSFGKFSASDVSGNFSYNPKTIYIRDFSMNTQEGVIKSDLRIDQTDDKLISESYATLNHVDISQMFYAFNEFGQTVITHQYIDGSLSGSAHIKASWDFNLNPIYKDLSLTSQVKIEDGELINYPPIMGLSDYIEVEELEHINFDRLQTSVTVDKEKVIIGQMQINSSAISLTGSGEHNFDNSYIYRFQVGLSDILWKKARKKKPANSEFGYVVDDGLGRHIIPLAITGKDTAFEVIYDKKTAGSLFQEKLLQEKQTWQELISQKDSDNIGSQPDIPIEWGGEQVKTIKDSNKTNNPNDNFQIEWEDD